MRSARTKIGLALGVLLACVVLAELWLRFQSPVEFMRPLSSSGAVGSEWPKAHRASALEDLAYELVPGAVVELDGSHVTVNSDGMRGAERLPDDTPGLVRIAVLGDSIGFGWRVESDESVGGRLASRLSADFPGLAFDVLNCGVAGYSTKDEIALFEHRVLALEPDIVVVAYCLNDPITTPQQPLPRFFYDVPLWQHSHLLRAIAKRRHDAYVRDYGGGDYYRYLHNPDGPEWPTVVAGFARLAALTSARGIPVAVAIFPWPREETWADYPYADLHAHVAELARTSGFVPVDLLDAFRARPPLDVVFGRTDPHPTAVGHDIASAELERALVPLVQSLAATRDSD